MAVPPFPVCPANTPGAAAIAVTAAPVFNILRLIGSIIGVLLAARTHLLQLILHLRNARLCAGFLLRLAARRTAQADGADRIIADHDWNAAAERDDIRQTALSGDIAFGGPFRPL